MRRSLLLVLGWVLVVVGLIELPFPLPFGIYLIGIGSAILIANSRVFRRFIQFLRRRYPRICSFLTRAETILPGALGRPLRRTGPHIMGRWERRRHLRTLPAITQRGHDRVS